MAKKKWFDDWEVKHSSDKNGHISKVLVTLPHSQGPSIIKFRSIKDARVKLLISWLDCALSELTYKK